MVEGDFLIVVFLGTGLYNASDVFFSEEFGK